MLRPMMAGAAAAHLLPRRAQSMRFACGVNCEFQIGRCNMISVILKGKDESDRRLENESESADSANHQTLELPQAPGSYA